MGEANNFHMNTQNTLPIRSHMGPSAYKKKGKKGEPPSPPLPLKQLLIVRKMAFSLLLYAHHEWIKCIGCYGYLNLHGV